MDIEDEATRRTTIQAEIHVSASQGNARNRLQCIVYSLFKLILLGLSRTTESHITVLPVPEIQCLIVRTKTPHTHTDSE
jgi:hypothetical protein